MLVHRTTSSGICENEFRFLNVKKNIKESEMIYIVILLTCTLLTLFIFENGAKIRRYILLNSKEWKEEEKRLTEKIDKINRTLKLMEKKMEN